MKTGTRRTEEKANTLQEFTLTFWKNQILIGNTRIPLGECSTDILNLSQDTLFMASQKHNEFVEAMKILFNPHINKDFTTVTETQNTLNEALEFITGLPPFRYLLDKDFGRSILIDIFNDLPVEFQSLVNENSRYGKI